MATARTTEFCCVRCSHSTLIAQQQALLCNRCGTVYPIVHEVPILFPDVVIEATAPPELAKIVTSVVEYQGFQPEQDVHATLESIFSKKYRFSDFLLDVESHQYLDRIYATQGHLTAEPAALNPVKPHPVKPHPVSRFIALKTAIKPFVPQPLHQKISQLRTKIWCQQLQSAAIPPAAPEVTPFDLKYEWVGDYLPRIMSAKQYFMGNVRLQNRGDSPISSQGPTPVMISYQWQGPDDTPIDGVLQHRTPLPVDLQPGQPITVPMLLDTPQAAGHYQLQLCLVQEHVCWHEADAITLPITITAAPLPDPTTQWAQHAPIDSYRNDHIEGINQLKSQLANLGTTHPKILEIGGNACPMLFHNFSGQLYNLDIDVHGLQIGQLMDRQVRPDADRMRFVCADANAIPFPDDYFDCIAMFASLHHFPDLRVILRSLAQKIQPQGFLAMLCEPVGHYYGAELDPIFRTELLKGVNEQTFSLTEYAAIFADAGLIVDRVTVHGGSLKAFLKKPTTLI
jgi:SAM-dependent methyltransferase/uncharacterized protein YbaR (Trm112 family)